MIDNTEKLKDIDKDKFGKAIEKMVNMLTLSYNVTLTDEVFEYTVDQLIRSLPYRYPNWMFGEIREVYKCILDGRYGTKKISAHTILEAFNNFNNAKIERNKRDFHEQEGSNRKYRFDCNKYPVGKAILFRMQQRQAGNTDYDKYSLKEIAEMIKNKQIKLK